MTGDRASEILAEHGIGPDDSEGVILAAAPAYPVGALCGPLREFVDWAVLDGLHPEAAAAAGLAALVTLTGPASLKISEAKMARAILWIAAVGIASSGKSPAFEHAFALIQARYALVLDEHAVRMEQWDDAGRVGGCPAEPETLTIDDATMEALARWVSARQRKESDPTGAAILDELADLLESLNQYRSGKGGDRSKWLKLWTGAPLNIKRVGSGGKHNEVNIFVPRPVISLAGPLTPDNLHLLGKQGSGFRPRWLPHLVPSRAPAWNHAGPYPDGWKGCIDALLDNRAEREWLLDGPARELWESARARWARQQGEPEPDDVIEALRKADAQCYRIALVLAESLAPGKGGPVPAEAMHSAIAIIDYVIGCWSAMPGGETMASSRAEDVMDAVSLRFLNWLENRPEGNEGLPSGSRPRPRATRREIQQWIHLPARKLSALIMEHGARYPGCVASAGGRADAGKGQSGGLATVYVYAPERRSFGVAATPKTGIHNSRPEHKTAGQPVADSVLRSATPKDRNTESATPKDRPGSPAPASPPEAPRLVPLSGWEPGTIGDAENQPAAARTTSRNQPKHRTRSQRKGRYPA